ncbi:glycosyltransferase family 2 protein [Patescibacteria group bacterium]
MLSIIITHRQTPVLLKICLKSLEENIDSIEREIIITDCEADKETQELVNDEFPQARFISFQNNVGYAKLVNAGIRQAKGEYILILNADIIIKKGTISQMIDFIKNDSSIGIVGPQLLTFSNVHQDSCFKFPTIGMLIARRTFIKNFKWGKKKIRQFLINNKNYLIPRNVDWLQGSAMLVRKKAIDKVGLWDERFFMYFEDTDWCRRFWRNGYKVVYLPSACMFHYYTRQSKKWGSLIDPIFNKYTRIHLASAFKYFWKWRKL